MRYAVLSTALFGAAMFMAPGSHAPANTPHNNTSTASAVRIIQKPEIHLTLASKPAANKTAQPAVTLPTTSMTVATGDSLSSLATNHATTYERLYDANPAVTDPDLIFPGQELRVPAADETLVARELPANSPAAAGAEAAQAGPVATAVAPTRSADTLPAPAASVAGGSVWDQLAQCESGGNWAINTGNGFYGGIQFTLATWQSLGGVGYPNEASREEQIAKGEMLQARSGWGQWPACSAKLGLR